MDEPTPYNPYAPPEAALARQVVSVERLRRRFPLLLWLVLPPYFIFTGMLISSSPNSVDHIVGIAFGINAVVLVITASLATHDYRKSPYATAGGFTGQLIIMAWMILKPIGDLAPVIMINGAIASVFAILTMFYSARIRYYGLPKA